MSTGVEFCRAWDCGLFMCFVISHLGGSAAFNIKSWSRRSSVAAARFASSVHAVSERQKRSRTSVSVASSAATRAASARSR